MYITAMTHRDELFQLTLRWMNDDFQPEDGKIISRIFLYESAISSVVVNRLIMFLNRLFDGPLNIERVRQKQLLRERIIHYLPHHSQRNLYLADQFEQNPEYFFPRLPIDSIILTTTGLNMAATCRIKQLSRMAEKVSFRMVDALFQEIQSEARHIAGQRAAAAGLTLDQLESSPQTMHDDFVEAEARVARRFKNKIIRIPPESMMLNDIIGFKIIGEQEFLDRVPELLRREPGVTVVEIEHHTGDYKAVNLLIDIDLPDHEELIRLLEGIDWSISVRRGLDTQEIRNGISQYVSQGSRQVRMEIILTTYEELMESEFGRSIHELRILKLRQRQTYTGPIAQNAAYLVEYLLALACSPIIHVPELPVKMYGRYLPETIAASKWALYGHGMDGGILDVFCPELLYLRQS
jgi:hypothetical protein